MDVDKYQELAMRTLNPEIDKKELILNASMGLCGESGEVIDLVKKHLFQGHDLDDEKLIKELGDVAWYLAEAATALNVNLSEILEKNIKKLENRFPDGFNSNRSINRGE
ncbi:MAG: nucleoside triphosphate pyrophosphohydrolase family protein [Solobacterium sp.]|mgnify:FL=1|nr:nucleoside triphosphate pyrophosphohydrolase family protein [Solobacterium sp.]MDY5402223.1 nucleoside triphosphate pyrophosphohydrolase family protein [Erysipelotrichaceae bacterium]